MLSRSKSQDVKTSYPNLTLVQKKEYWYKVRFLMTIEVFPETNRSSLQTSPKERRKRIEKMRRSQSMDFDDHSTESEEVETKVYKLLSDTDIQVGKYSGGHQDLYRSKTLNISFKCCSKFKSRDSFRICSS